MNNVRSALQKALALPLPFGKYQDGKKTTIVALWAIHKA
jgi:hypothetical protein